jgi:hypothetical protein
MDNDWAILVRQYLAFARRDPIIMEQAITAAQAAQESEIVALLKAFQEQDIDTAVHYAAVLTDEALQGTLRVDAALIVPLLLADMGVQFFQDYSHLPFEERAQVLQIGLEQCDVAIHCAEGLGDLPCIAFYQLQKGIGFYYARRFDAAREAYELGLEMYFMLAKRQPQAYQVHLTEVSMTLNNLGLC